MKLLRTIATFFMLMACVHLHAQDPVFSQYYSSGLYLNPAMAGMEYNPKVSMNYRNQWSGSDVAFSTAQVSFVSPMVRPGTRSKQLGGVGFTLYSDQVGEVLAVNYSGLSVAGAYNFHFNNYGNHFLTIAAQGGYHFATLDPSRLQWASQYDANGGFTGTGVPTGLQVDGQGSLRMSLGAMYVFANRTRYVSKGMSFFTGVAVNNIVSTNNAFFESGGVERSPLYKLHGGLNIYLNKDVMISPNYLLAHQRGSNQINIGAYGQFSLSNSRSRTTPQTSVQFGAWYRVGDSFIFSTGLGFKQLTIGFSYDLNTSELNKYFGNSGALEISLGYKINKRRSVRRHSTPLI